MRHVTYENLFRCFVEKEHEVKRSCNRNVVEYRDIEIAFFGAEGALAVVTVELQDEYEDGEYSLHPHKLQDKLPAPVEKELVRLEFESRKRLRVRNLGQSLQFGNQHLFSST